MSNSRVPNGTEVKTVLQQHKQLSTGLNRYEQLKSSLGHGLSPKEYEQAIRKLARECRI